MERKFGLILIMLVLVFTLSSCNLKSEQLDNTSMPTSISIATSITNPTNTSNNPNKPEFVSKPDWVGSFYKKCMCSYGILILASDKVNDQAFLNCYWTLDAMLKKMAVDKPHILKQMIKNRARVLILGKNEYNYQLPEWSWVTDKTLRRSAGGMETTVTEENISNIDKNDWWNTNFSLIVHEFAHTILMSGISDSNHIQADIAIYKQIDNCYQEAIRKNLYTESAYDRTNNHEYFTGQSCRWFNANPSNLNVPNASKISDREQLKIYDPNMYKIMESLYGDYKLPSPWN